MTSDFIVIGGGLVGAAVSYGLLKLGATEYEKPTNVGGELMVCSVKDPWKNIIGLINNPYFKLPE